MAALPLPRDVLLRYGLPGFLGSVHLFIAAVGSGYLPLDSPIATLPIAEVLRSTFAGSVVTRVAVLMGIALLLQTWLVLGYDVFTGAVKQHRAFGWVLAAWCAPLVISPPLFSRDLFSYFAQGRLIAAGFDPYRNGVGVLDGWFIDGADPVWAQTPTPYGPVFLLLERAIVGVVGNSPVAAAIAFRLFALLGLAALVRLVPTLAQRCGVDPVRAQWLAVLNPLVVLDVASSGHNDAVMAAVIVAAFIIAIDRGVMWGAAAVAIAAAIKPIALLALPFVALVRIGMDSPLRARIRQWLVVTAVCGPILLLLSVVSTFGLGWIGALTAPTKTQTLLSISTMVGLAIGSTVDLVFSLDVANTVITITRVLGVLVAAGVLVLLLTTRQKRSAVKAAGIGIAVTVVLAPAVHSWYVLWFLPLLAAGGMSRRRFRASLLGIAVLALVSGASQSATMDTFLDVADGVAIVIAVVLVATALLASKRERVLVLGEQTAEGLR